MNYNAYKHIKTCILNEHITVNYALGEVASALLKKSGNLIMRRSLRQVININALSTIAQTIKNVFALWVVVRVSTNKIDKNTNTIYCQSR